MHEAEPEMPFEAILERLEAIATRLESGGTQLEESLSLFEEGVRLSKAATVRLDEAERKLEILLDDGRTAPFSPDVSEADAATNGKAQAPLG